MKKDKLNKITKRIIRAMEKGNLPWEKGHNSTGGFFNQRNQISRNRYTGINQISLTIAQEELGYESDSWLTFKQAKDLEGNVRKGEKGVTVIYSSSYVPKNKKLKEDDEEKKIFFIKTYTVFNTEQIEGVDFKEINSKKTFEHKEILKAEDVIPKNCQIFFGDHNSAHYIPMKDIINMPNKESFFNEDYYYATLFHEIAHWTGHASRLKRDGIVGYSSHGSELYAKEELIAELSSAMIMNKLNLVNETLVNRSASYLQGWTKAIKNDPQMILTAASKAEKVFNYIFNKEIS